VNTASERSSVITTRRAAQRIIDRRLRQAGDSVDTIVARARDARGTVNDGTFRRVDALRAREARMRARARELREADEVAWDQHSAELKRDLDELDTLIAISSARLDTDLSFSDAAFAGAVQAELEHWCAHLRAAPAEAAVQRAELDKYLEIARFKLEEFRDAAPAASPGLRVEVRQAVEDLERAAEAAAAGQISGSGSLRQR
jgi:hypothetical protein